MSKETSVKVFEEVDNLSSFFGTIIMDKIRKKNDNEYLSIALSGGSTPKLIFRFLTENFKEKINWSRILVFWGDERCVPPDDKESNYKMACDYLLNHVGIPPDNIFRVFGESNPNDEAKRYSQIVKSKLPSNNGIPVFDIVLLGLGDDGHTASIFPDNLSLFNTEKFFEVASHPQTNQNRITACGTIINFAKTIVFIATGTAKAEVISTILNKQGNWKKYPASYVSPKNGDLIWLLDKNAASVYIDTSE
ncbi:MAG: 6-phosphogluconolactonase [Marinilabiliales bacterium]|nr:MAG: 6-phosphogluconolactonase [Marinilabiliales bacterium]